ncbi:MAG: HisA/HisF-related TIM barrel protein, partial [Planctomycetota bacterium]
VILDVVATARERAAAVETVERVRRSISIPIAVGGGVRSIGDAESLLAAGADKVCINTAAVDRPALISELAARVGAQCVVIAIDAALRVDGDGWEVVTRAGTRRTGIDALAWARECAIRGAGEVLLTSWDRDGTRSGYDTALLTAMSSTESIPIIASGGADSSVHMVEAFEAGAHAVLAASIFHDRDTTVGTIKRELAIAGVEVRS